MAYYQEAVSICSSYAPAFYNIAVVYSEAGRAEVGPGLPSSPDVNKRLLQAVHCRLRRSASQQRVMYGCMSGLAVQDR